MAKDSFVESHLFLRSVFLQPKQAGVLSAGLIKLTHVSFFQMYLMGPATAPPRTRYLALIAWLVDGASLEFLGPCRARIELEIEK